MENIIYLIFFIMALASVICSFIIYYKYIIKGEIYNEGNIKNKENIKLTEIIGKKYQIIRKEKIRLGESEKLEYYISLIGKSSFVVEVAESEGKSLKLGDIVRISDRNNMDRINKYEKLWVEKIETISDYDTEYYDEDEPILEKKKWL